MHALSYNDVSDLSRTMRGNDDVRVQRTRTRRVSGQVDAYQQTYRV